MMSMPRMIAAAGLVVMMMAAPVTAATNFVVNGSFETNPLANNKKWNVFQSIDGFQTLDGAGLEIQRNGTLGGITTPFGDFYAELDSHNFGGVKNDGSNTLIGQVLDLHTGRYLLEFFYRARTNNGGDDNGVRAGIASGDGQGGWLAFDPSLEVSLKRNDQSGFERQTLEFVIAQDGNYLLGFEGFGKENTLGGLVDNISVVAVPEPSTWLMMLIGFAAVGYTLRRRNSDRAFA